MNTYRMYLRRLRARIHTIYEYSADHFMQHEHKRDHFGHAHRSKLVHTCIDDITHMISLIDYNRIGCAKFTSDCENWIITYSVQAARKSPIV